MNCHMPARTFMVVDSRTLACITPLAFTTPGPVAGTAPLQHLAEATRLDPTDPRPAAAYAIGLKTRAEARRPSPSCARASHGSPGTSRRLFILATILRDRGDLRTASVYADRLRDLWPNVPLYDRLADRLHASLGAPSGQ
jgi:hypothetical protein